MTATCVAFHHNAADRLQATCRLIAARAANGQKVLVFAPQPALAAQVDQALWQFDALSFVPHCMKDSRLKSQTPVLIAQQIDTDDHADVLVNCADHAPPGFARFGELIEVVGRAGEDRECARERFRFYREQGCSLSTIDLDQGASRG